VVPHASVRRRLRHEKVPCNLLGLMLGLMLCSLVVPLLFPISARAGTPIGDPFATSAADLQEGRPAVAYNTQWQEYLVVWNNDRAGNDDIRAQRLTKTGAPIGVPFYISAGEGAERRYPDVTTWW
jgi:hypothetical protein